MIDASMQKLDAFAAASPDGVSFETAERSELVRDLEVSRLIEFVPPRGRPAQDGQPRKFRITPLGWDFLENWRRRSG